MFNKYILLNIIVFIFVLNLNAEFTRNEAISLVLNQVLVDELNNIDVFCANSVVIDDTLQLYNDEFVLCTYSNNWVFFVDNMPFYNWYHPCRYIFISSDTGDYHIENHNIFPLNYENEFELISQKTRPTLITLPEDPVEVTDPVDPNEHLYALMICGGDGRRFRNDISALFCTLIDNYGYTKDNIIIHYCEGESYLGDDLDNDGEGDIDHAAYLHEGDDTTIEDTFEYLEATLGQDDQLFIFVDDHGQGDDQGNSSITLPDDDLTDVALAGYLENINCAQMIIVMQQCHSGGFIDNLADYVNYNVQCENRIVHTSCNYDEVSAEEVYITGESYCDFIYYWTAAVRGYYPITDSPWFINDLRPVGSFPFHEYTAFTFIDPEKPDVQIPIILTLIQMIQPLEEMVMG